jgi:hypothetical protein
VNGRRLDGARAIAIAPKGRNIYVTADYFGVVALKDTGRLVQLPGRRGCVVEEDRACTPGRTLSGDEAKSITLSPDGRYAYVAVGLGPRSHPRATLAVLKRVRGGGLRELPGRRGCLVVRPPRDQGRHRSYPTCTERRAFGDTAASAITPDGRLLYVTGNNSIATFRRDRRSGALSQPRGASGCVSYNGRGGCTPSPNLRAPTDIAVAPDGLHVYVASRFAVSVYMRRGTTLRRVRGRAGCANVNGRAGCTHGRGLYDVALNVTPSADGRHLYTGVGGDCCDLDGRLVIFGLR